jgi:hypothetical protein
MSDTENSVIKPPVIKWVESRNRFDQLDGIGASFHLGMREEKVVVVFKKLPPTTRDLYQARGAIEEAVKRKWQKWLVRTTII